MVAANPSKVMLVEDDMTMRSVLRTLLEIEGYKVVSLNQRKAEAEIVDVIKAEMPDILLMDVHVYDTNGIDVLRQMRTVPELKTMKVIMSSGMDKHDECMAAGATNFLLKPYMPDELIQMLRA